VSDRGFRAPAPLRQMHEEASQITKILGSKIFRDSCTITVVDERRVIYISVRKALIPSSCSAFGARKNVRFSLSVSRRFHTSTLLATYAPVVHKITKKVPNGLPDSSRSTSPLALAYARVPTGGLVMHAGRTPLPHVSLSYSYPTRPLVELWRRWFYLMTQRRAI
jgi:hypothetical protein